MSKLVCNEEDKSARAGLSCVCVCVKKGHFVWSWTASRLRLVQAKVNIWDEAKFSVNGDGLGFRCDGLSLGSFRSKSASSARACGWICLS